MRTLLFFLLAVGVPRPAQPQPLPFRVHEVADSVYVFETPDPTMGAVSGNSVAVLTAEGIVVFDAQHYPAYAHAVIAWLRQRTPLPVRVLVESHFHPDHTAAAQVWREAYPALVLLTHATTKAVLDRKGPERLAYYRTQMAGELDYFRQALAKDSLFGQPMTPVWRQKAREYVREIETHLPDLQTLQYQPPDSTFADRMTLRLGGRRMDLYCFGRAHSPADVVLHLPRERVLLAGDIVVRPVPYMHISYLGGYAAVLDSLLALRPDVLVPGHGVPIRGDLQYLRDLQKLVSSTYVEVARLAAAGASLDDIRKQLPLTELRAQWTHGDANLEWAFEQHFRGPALRRAYLEALGQLDPQDPDN